MPTAHNSAQDYRITPRAGLSGDELLQVAALKAICDAEEGLDLKVHPDMQRGDARTTDTIIATTWDGTLVGVCTLDGGSEIEVCGMVHPAHRRRGLGRALLNAALAACRERSAWRVLVICEDASAVGLALLAAALPTARLDFKEHRLEVQTPGFIVPAPAPQLAALVVRVATGDDLDTLAATQAAAFGERKQGIRPGIAADLNDPSYRFYLATLDGTPVSSLKVIFAASRAYIYAFGVVPEQRRQGIGRAVLATVIGRLRNEGWRRVTLEVESENAPALALYRSLGFAPITTYGYYAVAM
jgi:ribosomal protein S18 acetylase RimI-like enzyme